MCRIQIGDWLIDSTKQKTWKPKKFEVNLTEHETENMCFRSRSNCAPFYQKLNHSFVSRRNLALHSDHVLVNKETNKCYFSSTKALTRSMAKKEPQQKILTTTAREKIGIDLTHILKRFFFRFCIRTKLFLMLQTLKTNERDSSYVSLQTYNQQQHASTHTDATPLKWKLKSVYKTPQRLFFLSVFKLSWVSCFLLRQFE